MDRQQHIEALIFTLRCEMTDEEYANLPAAVRSHIEAIVEIDRQEAEAALEVKKARDRRRAEEEELRQHNDDYRKKYGKALAKRMRASTAHLTAYELGGSCTTKAIEVEAWVDVWLGIRFTRRSDSFGRQRAHEPDEEAVARQLQKWRLTQSRNNKRFGVVKEDAAEVSRRLQFSRDAHDKNTEALRAFCREHRIRLNEANLGQDPDGPIRFEYYRSPEDKTVQKTYRALHDDHMNSANDVDYWLTAWKQIQVEVAADSVVA